MKETLISFETAKLAKEKGFNIPCMFIVNVAGYDNSYEYIGKPIFTLENCENAWENDNEDCYLAPTQSLLQRWLREVHDVHIDLHRFTNQQVGDAMWEKVYQVFVNGEAFHPYYKTYEEALEEGLQKGLKLN